MTFDPRTAFSPATLAVAKLLYGFAPERQSWDGDAYAFEELFTWEYGWTSPPFNRAATAVKQAEALLASALVENRYPLSADEYLLQLQEKGWPESWQEAFLATVAGEQELPQGEWDRVAVFLGQVFRAEGTGITQDVPQDSKFLQDEPQALSPLASALAWASASHEPPTLLAGYPLWLALKYPTWEPVQTPLYHHDEFETYLQETATDTLF